MGLVTCLSMDKGSGSIGGHFRVAMRREFISNEMKWVISESDSKIKYIIITKYILHIL